MKDNIIVIESYKFWSDWTSIEKDEINLNDIIGFNFHWRSDDWHIEVVTKKRKGEYEFYSYELNHGVYPRQVAVIIADKRCKILKFINTHNSDNFIESINNVIDWSKK